MSTILKFSEAASIAIHSMGLIALSDGKPITAREIARSLDVSLNHLSKVLQRLVHAGFVKSTRGPAGGFVLAVPPERISILSIYEAIEGSLDSGTCLLGTPICGGEHCPLGKMISSVFDIVRTNLSEANLLAVTEVFRRKSLETQRHSD